MPATQPTQSFHFYFYTAATEATGSARVGFRNKNDASNKGAYTFTGITSPVFSVHKGFEGETNINVYPNPASSVLNVSVDTRKATPITLTLCSVSGVRLFSQQFEPLGIMADDYTINIQDFPAGIYFLYVETGNGIAGPVKLFITK
jgi:hypothetical protein